MSIQIISKEKQARGAFNGGEIVENKPIGFPGDGGTLRPYSNLFYWAYAEAKVDSTIGLHPHQGFEIMSFVLKGNIRHFDTKLGAWRPLKAGDAQVIRAGSGVSHSEFMAEGSAMFQIWFDPDLTKTLNQPASYDDYSAESLPVSQDGDVLIKTYIGSGSPVTLDTPGLEVHRFNFEKSSCRHHISSEKLHSLYAINGSFKINGEAVKAHDFVILKDVDELHIESEGAGDVFMVSNLAQLGYQTYTQLMQQRRRM